MQHTAIKVSSKVDKNELIHLLLKGALNITNLDLQNLKGEVFSKQTQEQFIDEELKHDRFEINSNNKRSLITFSDGEQKKALLAYLIAKQPNYLILDNIFDNLDMASQRQLLERLTQLNDSISIIQIANRRSDFLPFIQQVYRYEHGKIQDEKVQENLTKANSFFSLSSSIPLPLHENTIQQNSLVQFNDVSVSYDERLIVNKINWEINAGEFWQLIGANGSGKSTLLSMIIGDNPKAYNQDLILFGKKKGTGETIWEIKAKIGYLNSLMIHLFSRRDSIENMVISGFFDSVGLYTKPSELQIKLADDWLKLIGLFEVKQKVFVDLPVGQQRLVLIVRAMVKHPPLLILDEPTTGLDDNDAAMFVALVNKIAVETKSAIVYVSHRKEERLKPQFIYELTTTENGSIGVARKN